MAAHRGHHGVVEQLLNRNADLLHGNRNPGLEREAAPLSLAIDGNHKRIVNMLLDHGADPNYRINSWEPVFFRAVQIPGVLRLVLNRGADPKICNKSYESVHIRALETGTLAASGYLTARDSF